MPTALIADDEEAPRAQLSAELREAWPTLRVVAECVNGADAWDAFLELAPEVCFLDLRMPGMTGIEVAQRIGLGAHIVFVAAPGDHALAAFDAAAVDCVLKPVEASRLAQAVARVRARLAAPGGVRIDLQPLLNRLAGQVRKPAPLDVVEAAVGKEARPVRVEEVVCFEAEGRHTRVLREGGEADGELLLRTPLKDLVGQLDPAEFWQIHRSAIVNRRHIAGAERTSDDRLVLHLRGRREPLPVARHFESLFPDFASGR